MPPNRNLAFNKCDNGPDLRRAQKQTLLMHTDKHKLGTVTTGNAKA